MSGSPALRHLRLCFALLVALAIAVGCASTPEPAPAEAEPAAATAPPVEDPGKFSASRAWRHLEGLARIGSRPPQSRGSRRTRAYLQLELESAGLAVREQHYLLDREAESIELSHVIGTIAGASSDRIVLVANRDSRADAIGANEGGSAIAVLLELARVLARTPQPYTIEFVFLDGNAFQADLDPVGAGSRLWVEGLAAEERLDSIRMAAFFDRIADPNLRVTRDLASHRGHREIFFDAAMRVGAEATFPESGGFSSSPGPHLALAEAGVRPVVAIVGTSALVLPADPPAADDLSTCSPTSLESVGVVSVAAVEELSARLASIDRFAEAPLEADPEWGSFATPESASPSDEPTEAVESGETPPRDDVDSGPPAASPAPSP